MKPMKQWTVEEVAVWLHCIGLADAVADDNKLFTTTTGHDLCDIASRTPELVRVLGTDQTEKLLQLVEFTKSIAYNEDDRDELTATLENIILEKEKMEEELAIKNERIRELEKKVKELTLSQDGTEHPEDRVLAMEHRHEQERRQMEEHHELETSLEEMHIQHDRKMMSAAESLGKEQPAPLLGKRHFKEQPTDIHKYY